MDQTKGLEQLRKQLQEGQSIFTNALNKVDVLLAAGKNNTVAKTSAKKTRKQKIQEAYHQFL